MNELLKAELIATLDMAEKEILFLQSLVTKYLDINPVSSIIPLEQIKEAKQKIGEA